MAQIKLSNKFLECRMFRITLASLMLAGCAVQQENSSVSHVWAELTRFDVEAAYRILVEDHPGFSSSVNDLALQHQVNIGRNVALSRASQVSNFEGYSATLKGFANSAGDKHIWSRTPYQNESLQWAGIIVSLKNNKYIVVQHLTNDPIQSLEGAELLACDDTPIANFAETKLGGFYADWSVTAQRIQTAPLLLIDNRNPFIKIPKSCTFLLKSKVAEHQLKWTSISRSELRKRLVVGVNRGAAGHGIRTFPGGYWIAMQSLSEKAEQVVTEALQQQQQLQKAPMVVLDLRGNSGGNSNYGDRLARILFSETSQQNLKANTSDATCEPVWRISVRNVKQVNYYLEMFGDTNPEFAKQLEPIVKSVNAAKATGQEFNGPISCGDRTTASVQENMLPRIALPEAAPTVVLLTDNVCFSSCLNVVKIFRELGAIHVGQATDAATNYMEVRENELPSGLSFFSTLQAYAPAVPSKFGPFIPVFQYDADIADTEALETWILDILSESQRIK